jgi:cellulose biosynthesis protein BcsQ
MGTGCVVIWSLVHAEGGVGKTTTAMFSAVAAVRRGVLVRVVAAATQGSDLTAIERAFGCGIPRYLSDYEDVFDELMTAGIDREAAKV